MANNNTRPLIGMNGIFAGVLMVTIVLWGFRYVLLNDLGLSVHGADGESAQDHGTAEMQLAAVSMADAHAAETPAAPEAAVVEQPAAPAPVQVAQAASGDANTFKPADYVVFDQDTYSQLAATGVNWTQGYQAPTNAQPVVRAEVAQAAQEAPAAEEAPAPAQVAVVGDAGAGEKLFQKRCKSCHQAEEGAKHRTGPTLWGIVGHKAGSMDGYTKYSNDLSDWGGTWDAASLDQFLTKPKDMFKRTRMSFAGLKDEQDRADIIAYLETLK